MWKHHNLRVAYVAQHHFHNLQTHTALTPIQYIQKRSVTEEIAEGFAKVSLTVTWCVDRRFAKGHDEEMMGMAALALTDEEKKTVTDGRVEAILGRRTHRGKLEYEVCRGCAIYP